MLHLAVALAFSAQAAPKPEMTLGVWYEGGVGAFRQDLIPADPLQAEPLYLRNFKDIAAHGIQVVVAPNSPSEHHKTILDSARKAGVKLILELGPEGGELGAIIRGNTPIDTKAISAAVTKRLTPIAAHPALQRVQLLDEPWPEIFDRYAKVAELVKPTKPPFTCLIESGGFDAFLTKTKSDVVAFDCYPLAVNTPVGDPAALGKFKRVALEATRIAGGHDSDVWAVVQCHSITGGLRMPTEAELRWMTHTSLAAGCKGVFWFLYQTEWLNKDRTISMDGLVDPQYRERPLWAEIGRLARQIRLMQSTLAALQPLGIAKGVASNGDVYELTNDKKERFFYVVNPSVQSMRIVDLRFEANPPARLEAIPLGRKVDFEEGAFRTRLEPGEGALLRVAPARAP
jgi:hypothetical protein